MKKDKLLEKLNIQLKELKTKLDSFQDIICTHEVGV